MTSTSLDRESLVAWVQADVTLVGFIYVSLAIVHGLVLVANACIREWNLQNHDAHGHDSYFQRHRVQAHSTDARSKLRAVQRFSLARRRSWGLNKIIPAASASASAVGEWKRFAAEVKLNNEEFGTGLWGMGMAFAEKKVAGRLRVVVAGFRQDDDDLGGVVLAPGLEAGLQIGDTILAVDGTELVGGLQELKVEVNEDNEEDVKKQSVVLDVERQLGEAGNAEAQRLTDESSDPVMEPETAAVTLRRRSADDALGLLVEGLALGNQASKGCVRIDVRRRSCVWCRCVCCLLYTSPSPRDRG